MKIFLLAITILLLLTRIKNTPRSLSKKIFDDKNLEFYEKNKINYLDDKERYEVAVVITWIISLIMCMFLIWYYIMIGSQGNSLLLILSAVQVFAVFITMKHDVETIDRMIKIFDDYQGFKFYRWHYLFNLILDYVYYPLAIYTLIS